MPKVACQMTEASDRWERIINGNGSVDLQSLVSADQLIGNVPQNTVECPQAMSADRVQQ
ncbi:hypothetical protein [Stenomitos frigidus]|nr:hypothetical protein [Stenomitos frigidus]